MYFGKLGSGYIVINGEKYPVQVTQIDQTFGEPTEFRGFFYDFEYARGGVIPVGKSPIKNVIFNNPATVVIWEDGTKTVVKCQPGDTYSKETGLALCIAKKYLGNKGNFNEVFKKWIPEESEPVEEFPFYEMWGRLREEIEMGVEEGRVYGYDDPKSENFGKFYVYERILKKMNALEAYRKEK